ncbi:MAG: hypothetical protein AB1814_03325 [Thermodesulfobacteriota bacterium]
MSLDLPQTPAAAPTTAAAPPAPALWRGLVYKLALVLAWVLLLRLLPWSRLPDSMAGVLGPWLGLDRPGGWRWFLAGLAPLGLWLTSAAGHWLAACCNGRAPEQARRLLAWDWLAYLALPLLLLFSGLRWPAWPLFCGLAYLLALTLKAGLAGALLWRAAAEEPNSPAPRWLPWGCGLLCLSLYLACVFWVVQAVSTSGDETIYLIQADRLLAGLGLPFGDAAQPAQRLAFYWGRWSPALGAPLRESWAFTLLLAPGFGLAGRVGALAVLCLAGAGAVALFAGLALRLGYRSRVALAGTLLLGLCLPMLTYTQHVYPAALGVLFSLAGLLLLLNLERGAFWRLAALAGLAVAAALCKFRLIPTALGLALAAWLALYRQRPRLRPWLVWGGAALLGLTAALIVATRLGAPGLQRLDLYLYQLHPFQLGRFLLSIPALFFDQQFGLLPYAPWLLLGLAGAARFGREQPAMFTYSLCVFLVGLGLVAAWRWLQWDGGFAPPGRFLAPALPILALWALPALARPGWLWRWLLATLAGLSALASLIFTLIPQWVLHRRVGINNLLAWLDGRLDSSLHRLFPVFSDPTWLNLAPALPWLILAAAAAVYLWYSPQPTARRRQPGLLWPSLLGLALILAVGAGLVVLSRHLPSREVQAESMYTGRAPLYGDYFDKPVLLVLRRPGESGRTRIVGPAGEMIVRACRYDRPPRGKKPPVIAFYLDGREMARLPVAISDWRDYRLPFIVPPGRHTLSVAMLFHNSYDAVALDRLILR